MMMCLVHVTMMCESSAEFFNKNLNGKFPTLADKDEVRSFSSFEGSGIEEGDFKPPAPLEEDKEVIYWRETHA